MKKIFSLNWILIILIFFNMVLVGDAAFSASKAKTGEEDEIKKVEESVDILVKKIYSSSLFSPEDAEKLVDIKTKLDAAINTNVKDPMYARLYFDVGYICKEREYMDESVQYFKLVNEKFPETPYAKRAVNELKKMGVKLESDEEDDEESD